MRHTLVRTDGRPALPDRSASPDREIRGHGTYAALRRPVTIVVIDDEPLAVDRLSHLLQHCEDAEVIAASFNSSEGIEQIATLRPDAIFIDVEMPGLDGFDVVEHISRHLGEPGYAPLIVFVSAHPRFAVKAFEAGAVDFLSKPVGLARLATTLGRIKTALEQRESVHRLHDLQLYLASMRHGGTGKASESEHLWIHRRGELIRLNIGEVKLIRAEAEYVRLFHADGSHLYRDTIGAFEARLGSRDFIRIHRSTIVRKSEIVGLKRTRHGALIARLATDEELPIGRKYARSTREVLLGQPTLAVTGRTPERGPSVLAPSRHVGVAPTTLGQSSGFITTDEPL